MKRELILNVALDFIAEGKTTKEITISSIADKLGMGKSTIYEYYKSKEEIFFEAINYFFEKKVIMFSRIFDIKSFEEKLVYMIQTCESVVIDNAPLFLSVSSSICEMRNGIDSSKMLEIKYKVYEFVENIVEQGIKEGIFTKKPDKFEMMMTFVTIVNVIIFVRGHSSMNVDFNKTQKETLDYSYQLFIKMLK